MTWSAAGNEAVAAKKILLKYIYFFQDSMSYNYEDLVTIMKIFDLIESTDTYTI